MLKNLLIKAAFFSFFITITLFSLPAYSMVGEGCGSGGACTDCHSLEISEANELLRTEQFKFEILNIKMSEVKGLWQVEMQDAKGAKGIIYVDFAKKYVVQGKFIQVGDIGKPPKLRKVAVEKIPLDDAVIMGKKDAPIRVIVLDDPDCPYCKKLHGEIKKILTKRDDISFYIKMYPLPMHKEAMPKSRAIACSKSIEMLEDAFDGKEIPEATCPGLAVDETIALTKEFKINGTPAIILPDGRLISGYLDASRLLFVIDAKPDEENEENENKEKKKEGGQ